MTRRGAGCVAMLCLGAALLGGSRADALTPMEKAMRALAQATRQATATVVAGTPAAVNTPLPTPTALPTGAVPVIAPALNTPAAQAAAATLTAVAAEPTPLADPISLTASATAEEIRLSWSNTTSAWADFSGYWVLRGLAGEDPAPVQAGLIRPNYYQDLSATPEAVYEYRVNALASDGNTLAMSAPVVIGLAPSLPPDPPLEPQAQVEEERVRLSWKAPARTSHAVSGYAVFRDGNLLNTKTHLKTEYYDDTGVYRKPYLYTIATVDAWGVTGPASTTITAYARSRGRNGLVLLSSAYRGLGRMDGGLNADIQFTYFIGTLYGEQDKALDPLAVYLDPISVWLLTADPKWVWLTEPQFPLSLATGAKGSLLLFAGQQSSTGGALTLSSKSTFEMLWSGYLAASKSFGEWGVHAAYHLGTTGQTLYYLSKYLEPVPSRHLLGFGVDFPISRRINAAAEVLFPADEQFRSPGHPILVNTHIDRLLNFDISFLHWDRGWALLGFFNLRFTVFPGDDR